MDVIAEMVKNRPDTKWRLMLFTNIRVKVCNTNFTLGAVENGLPIYITRSKAIVTLDKAPSSFKPYKDQLCLFRCLSLHRNGSVDKDKVLALYDQWEKTHNKQHYIDVYDGCTTTQFTPPTHFKDMQLQDLPEFKQCFQINVQVYSLQEDGIVTSVFKSTERYADTLYVNQQEKHCSYIKDFSEYAKKFQCQLCDRMFNIHGNFKQHAKICDKRTLYVYPGGFVKEQPSVFQRLEEFWIHVPENGRTFPSFAL